MQSSQLEDIISLFKASGFKSAKLLVQVILIIIDIGHVGLYKIACKITSRSDKHDSKERSLRRLLDKSISAETYAKFINLIFKFSSNAYEFAMDRTNWKLGKTAVNLFVLSFNWHNIAIPLYWKFLDNKGGNSNSDDRKSLISWFIKLYGADKILNLFADREFPSIEFIKFLLAEEVNIIFRIKDKILATDTVKGKLSMKKLSRLFRALNNGNYKAEEHIRRLLDNRVFVSAKRNMNRELIVLISNQFHKDPFKLYSHRWHIECMFNKMKTKGFNLESTHITKENRIVTLVVIISLAYCYCCYIGELKNSIAAIKEKFINDVKCKTQSIFRCGFDVTKYLITLAFFGCDKVIRRQIVNLLNGKPIKASSKIYNIMLNF
jgi:hypothetical protein